MSTPESTQPAQKSWSHRLVSLLAAGLGTGWIPFMPGTWGSLLGLALIALTGAPWWLSLVITLFAWVVIHQFEKQTPGHDHSSTVIDEVAGLYWAFLFVPINLPTLLAAFVLFRGFDIAKPFPISWADRSVPGALGTLLDDVLAGLATCAVLHGLIYGGLL